MFKMSNKKMSKSILFILLLLVFTYSAQSQRVMMSSDTNDVKIAEPITLQLDFELITGENLISLLPNDTLSNNIEILEILSTDTLSVMEEIRFTSRFLITSFESGTYDLPPAYAIVQNQEGDLDTFYSNPLMLRFATVEVDTTLPIKGIKPPMDIPLTWREYIPYILLALGAVLLIGFIIYYIRKMPKKTKEQVKYDPEVPAHIEALKALAELNEQKLWQNEKYKQYYIRLTEILRIYIERRYEINALEMVTDEILENLEQKSLRTDLLGNMRKVLSQADLAKFAKYRPLAEENNFAMEFAVEFVEQTKQAEAPKPITANPSVPDNKKEAK